MTELVNQKGTADRPALTPPFAFGRSQISARIQGGWLNLLAVAFLVSVVLLLGNDTWTDIINLTCIAAIAAIGLDLVMGHAGLVSIGNAAFLGIGATTVALIQYATGHSPMVVSVLSAGLVCGVIGGIVAIPSFRITGLYLAISTLAFHFIALYAIREVQTGLVGDSGFVIPKTDILYFELSNLRRWFVFLALVLLLVVIVNRAMLLRKPGRVWHAIRERPALAEMSGVSVARYKVTAFVISSFFIGIAGGLQAFYIGNVSYSNFSLDLAVSYLAMVILGGMGSTYGAVFGAAFIVASPTLLESIRSSFHLDKYLASSNVFLVQTAIVGVLVVLVILFQPKGLAALGTRLRDHIKSRQASIK